MYPATAKTLNKASREPTKMAYSCTHNLQSNYFNFNNNPLD